MQFRTIMMDQKSQYFDERWKSLELFLKEKFEKMPNTESILFLIGLNEYRGRIPKIKFSKEQKQDLIHIGVCSVLSTSGYYTLEGYDDEGWPHFQPTNVNIEAPDYTEQDQLIKEHILKYFDF
jgi:hypothetical protein